MRSIKLIFILIITVIFLSGTVFSAEGGGGGVKKAAESGSEEGGSNTDERSDNVRLGGGNFGPGTEAEFFNDESLIKEPTPTVTPYVKYKGYDVKIWKDLDSAMNIIKRVETDLPRYEKEVRKNMDKDLNGMADAISSIHTAALLDRRDQVEHVWKEKIEKAETTLAIAEGYRDEFKEDYKALSKSLKRTEKFLKSNRKKIQRIEEAIKKHEFNKREAFFVKKGVDKFDDMYKRYQKKFKMMVKNKDDRVKKLLDEHRALHRP